MEMEDVVNEFEFDATGIDMDGLLVDGEYDLKIDSVKPMKSKKGFPMVQVIFVEPMSGKSIWHYVTFMPAKDPDGLVNRGAGIALFFLSCIGEPHEPTKLKIEPFNWIGKTVKAKVIAEEYNGKRNNKIKNFIKPLEGLAADDNVPF